MLLLFSMADGYYTDLVGLNPMLICISLQLAMGPIPIPVLLCKASNIAQLILGQQN